MRFTTCETATDRLLAHADYLDRCGRRNLAADLRRLIGGLKSIAVIAEAHVSGQALVAPEAIALAARRFLAAPPHGRQVMAQHVAGAADEEAV